MKGQARHAEREPRRSSVGQPVTAVRTRATGWWWPVLAVVLVLGVGVPLLVASLFGGLVLGVALEFLGPPAGVVLLTLGLVTRRRRPGPLGATPSRLPDAAIAGFATRRQRFHLVVVAGLLLDLPFAIAVLVVAIASDDGMQAAFVADPLALAIFAALGLGPLLIIGDVLWALNRHVAEVENESIRSRSGRWRLIRAHRVLSVIVGSAYIVLAAAVWALAR